MKKYIFNRRDFVKHSSKGMLGAGLAFSGLSSSLLAFAKPRVKYQGGLNSPNWDDFNIGWKSPSKDASESMPVGGGDMALNVWVEEGDLFFYIQRSGCLDENGEFLKLGRVRVNLSPNPFLDYDSFNQELLLKKGHIVVVAQKKIGVNFLAAAITIWVDIENPVIHVDINANQKIMVKTAFESWRFRDKELAGGNSKERFGCFSLEGYPGKVLKTKDTIIQSPKGILFYHRNPKEKLIPEILIQQQSLGEWEDEIRDDLQYRIFGGLIWGPDFIEHMQEEGAYAGTPYQSWSLKCEKPKTTHKLLVATHVDQQEDIEKWKKELLHVMDRAKVQNDSYEKTVGWWKEFWDRSWISIFSENPDPSNPVWQMGRNYQLFRYQLGCNVFGEYPTKFNGGNLTFDPVLVDKQQTFDPDWRAWGGDVFTAQNQRLLHWPMLKSGDFDAIIPQFELYKKGLPGATARVKKHFGHNGAVYSEYTSVPGVVFGAGWGWKGDGHRGRGTEIPFGDPRANGARGYNDLVEEGVMANQSCAYHWESQVEHAYMIMEYHRFSGLDITSFLPFIKSAVFFFDEHYQLREKMRSGNSTDINGKLVLFPSTSCESYRGAKNPSDLIAGLRACLESMLNFGERLMSNEERAYFKGFLERIPDYSFDEVNGKEIIKPAAEWLKEANQELPQFYPLFPFDQFKLGDAKIQTFKNTYQYAPDFRKGTIQSWHQDGIFFARMGMTTEAADYNTRKLKDSGRRFPTFWGPGHDWVPDHNWGGSGMIGLQEMLMQTIGDQIVLFPAWPNEWDVHFKLHAPNQTTVECHLKAGIITKLELNPKSRTKDIVIGNQEITVATL